MSFLSWSSLVSFDLLSHKEYWNLKVLKVTVIKHLNDEKPGTLQMSEVHNNTYILICVKT